MILVTEVPAVPRRSTWRDARHLALRPEGVRLPGEEMIRVPEGEVTAGGEQETLQEEEEVELVAHLPGAPSLPSAVAPG